jgi:hypothetical protein
MNNQGINVDELKQRNAVPTLRIGFLLDIWKNPQMAGIDTLRMFGE